MIKVCLSYEQLIEASEVGCLRHIESITRGLTDKHGANPDRGWQYHVEGACGEKAFAVATNRHWSKSVNTFKSQGDVEGIEVRTRSRADYELIVRPNDPSGSTYVLVLGLAPYYQVMGWIGGAEAKMLPLRSFDSNRPPVHFVPRSLLYPIDDLVCGKDREFTDDEKADQKYYGMLADGAEADDQPFWG